VPHAGFRWEGAARRELTCGSGGHSGDAVQESGSVLRVCFVYSPFLYRCCSCCLCFTVLLNCPYPDPPFSACFFPFSSAQRQGEGRPREAFVAGCSPNQNRPFFNEPEGEIYSVDYFFCNFELLYFTLCNSFVTSQKYYLRQKQARYAAGLF